MPPSMVAAPNAAFTKPAVTSFTGKLTKAVSAINIMPLPMDGALSERRALSTPGESYLDCVAPLPKDAEELLRPLAHAARLPEWAEGYLALLTESTSSKGSMQNHLMKLLVRGAARTGKLVELAQNPLDGVIDCLADTGSDALLKRWAEAHGAAGAAAEGVTGWKRLRLTVLGTSCFKAASEDPDPMQQRKRSKDDTCIPEPNINPVHSQVLSIMLSMMMSGVASGPAAALAESLPLPHASIFNSHGAATAALSDADAKTTYTNASFGHANAPSLVSPRGSGSAEGIFGATGGMAATARRFLRGDSKCNVARLSPDLCDILENLALKTFESSVDGSQTHEAMQSRARA